MATLEANTALFIPIISIKTLRMAWSTTLAAKCIKLEVKMELHISFELPKQPHTVFNPIQYMNSSSSGFFAMMIPLQFKPLKLMKPCTQPTNLSHQGSRVQSILPHSPDPQTSDMPKPCNSRVPLPHHQNDLQAEAINH